MSDLNIVQSGGIQLPKFSLTPQGERWIEDALSGSALIGKVEDELQNNEAVRAAQDLKGVVNTLEKARVELTKPALEFQRQCKAFFDSKAEECRKEMFRLTKLCGDYAALQVAKARAAENARNAELSRLEREREAALAQSKSHDEREAVQAHFNERAAVEAAAPVATVQTAQGQSVKPDIEVEVFNIIDLARAHPACVKMEPRMTELKALIRSGMNPPGVRWKEAVKTQIRAPGQKQIEV